MYTVKKNSETFKADLSFSSEENCLSIIRLPEGGKGVGRVIDKIAANSFEDGMESAKKLGYFFTSCS